MKSKVYYTIFIVLLCISQDSFARKVIFSGTFPCARRTVHLIDPLEAQKRIMVLKLVFKDSQKSFERLQKKHQLQIQSTGLASILGTTILGLLGIRFATNSEFSTTQKIGAAGGVAALAGVFYYLAYKNFISAKTTFKEDKASYLEFLRLLRLEVEIEAQRYNIPDTEEFLNEIDKAQMEIGLNTEI